MNFDIKVEGNRIVLGDTIKAPKIITGTKVGAICYNFDCTGRKRFLNPYSSPFVAFMDLFRLAPPIPDNVAMKLGTFFEPKVIHTVNQMTGFNFKEYSRTPYYDFPKSGISAKYNGKIDGWDADRKIVLECKVTKLKNLNKWKNEGIPEYYALQMGLYAYLSGAKEMWLVAYGLTDNEYPQSLDDPIVVPAYLDKDRLWIRKYPLSDEIIKRFEEKRISQLEEFTREYLDKRISPEFNVESSADREILDFLGIKY